MSGGPEDKDLVLETRSCKDCGAPFTITVGEQDWYLKMKFTLPFRCKPCREARKKAKQMGFIADPKKETGERSRQGNFGNCGVCGQPLGIKGGMAETQMCGPCCTGESATLSEFGTSW